AKRSTSPSTLPSSSRTARPRASRPISRCVSYESRAGLRRSWQLGGPGGSELRPGGGAEGAGSTRLAREGMGHFKKSGARVMEFLLQLALNGVVVGSIYALVALGFVIIYKSS